MSECIIDVSGIGLEWEDGRPGCVLRATVDITTPAMDPVRLTLRVEARLLRRPEVSNADLPQLVHLWLRQRFATSDQPDDPTAEG